jgi:hypothetical protein
MFIKITIFWDITPCSPLNVNRRFGGTYRLQLQGQRISLERKQRGSRWQAEQKIVLFITIAVRTSDPTHTYIYILDLIF